MNAAQRTKLPIWKATAPAAIVTTASVTLYLTGYIKGFEWLRAQSHVLGAMSEWTPSLAIGFLLDIFLTVASGIIGTVLGGIVGYALLSNSTSLRRITWLGVQFLRNTPGLVLLFAIAFTLPFEIEVGHITIPFPAEAKVIFAFSVKIAANVAEIVRGAVNATPVGQWEAGTALGLRRSKVFRLVILPQCVPRMVPPWMNIMALFFTVVPIASLIGVYDAVNYAGIAINSEGNPNLIMPMYLYILTWFFGVAYILQELTRNLGKPKYDVGVL